MGNDPVVERPRAPELTADDIERALYTKIECPHGMRSLIYYARVGMDYLYDWRTTEQLQTKFVVAIHSALQSGKPSPDTESE
jgi:hypothetical protein